MLGNTHSAGSANGLAAGAGLGPLEGEWKLWVLLLAGIGFGIVGYKNWCWCIAGKMGNTGSFGHIGDCRSSRMSNHRLVEFEMNHKILVLVAVVVELAVVVVDIGGSHKRRNPLLLIMVEVFVLV